MPKKIVITGGSGYVAQNLYKSLAGAPDTAVTLLSRAEAPHARVVADYADSALYADCDVIIHCAAKAHTDDTSDAAVEEFFRANMELPSRMAKAISTLPRPPYFIFFSSLGAREVERKLKDGQHPARVRKAHPYQLSKLRAEQALAAYGNRLNISCLRPPLIYGPGAPGNLAKLVQFIERGWPLPTGLAQQPRGYCYIGNLLAAVEHLVNNPQRGFNIYEVGDDMPLSTRTLVAMLGTTYGKTPTQLPVPSWLFKITVSLLGQSKMHTRLFEPLPVDNSALQKTGWRPLFTVAEGLAALKSPGVAAPKIAL